MRIILMLIATILLPMEKVEATVPVCFDYSKILINKKGNKK